MRKRIGITTETSKPKTLSKLITGPKKKLDQDKYMTTNPGDSGVSDTAINSAAIGSPLDIDPTLGLTTDDIGSGQTLYERLTLSSGEYCPIYSPAFYRRVWFDGLEAFQPYHFTVDVSTGCVIPGTALSSNVVVTATYVKV